MISIHKELSGIKDKEYLVIVNRLNRAGAKVRIVGGCVRDAMLEIPFSDIDIITDFKPDLVIKTLSSDEIKVIPTGVQFGTVTAIFKNKLFEITTLRRDIIPDGRYALVEYTNSFKKDAMRRDFTINALSYCPIKHIIYDYFNGIDDLLARRVVFVGESRRRIFEDYLRILRFFRFSSRYAKELDEETLLSCIYHKDKILKLSRERIKKEMDAIFSTPNLEVLLKMANINILNIIFPTKQDIYILIKRLFNISKLFKVKPSINLIYAIIFTNKEIILEESLMKYKFTKSDRKHLLHILSLVQLNNIKNHLKIIWLKYDSWVDYFIYAYCITLDKSIYSLYLELSKRQKPVFPVNGHDITNLGYSRERVGQVLDLLTHHWVDTDFEFDKQDLLSWI